ncbi:asparagine synthase [Halanaerocella petrolearia]
MREGFIPTVLGTIVTTLGITLRSRDPILGWGVAGFGLAHIVLGAIDLFQHRSLENRLTRMAEQRKQQQQPQRQ